MREWTGLIGMIGSTQLVVQGLSFFAGILIVRRLSNTDEYAYYTIATAMLSMMTLLAEGGISAGVISQGGGVWRDPVELGKVVATGLELRRRFSAFSSVAIPVMLYLLMRHGASLKAALLILACLIPTYLASLSDSLLEVAPRLHQEIAPLQRNQIEVAFTRTVLTVVSVFTWPTCALVLLSTGISRIWGNIRLRKIATLHADTAQKSDPEYRRRILKVVWRILPESVYYCFSGQITIWAISIFGTTAAIGQLGGLTGIAQAMALMQSLMAQLLVPRFARLSGKKRLLVQRFLMAQGALILLGASMTAVVAIFPTPILWMLGKRFAGLKEELTLAFASAAVNLLNATANHMLSARGYIVPPVIFISFAIAVQVGLAAVMPLGQVYGALLYGLLTALCLYVIRLVYFFLQMRTHQDAVT